MATAVAMDIDQVEVSKGKSPALSINKSSAGKISKSSSLRKNNPIVQQAKPAPTSKVYNTDPMSFRNLVQQLTGCDAPPSDPNPPPPPPPEAAPMAPPSYHPSLSAYQQPPLQQVHQLQQANVRPQVILPDPGAPPRHIHVDPPLPGSPSSGSTGVSSPHQSSSRPVNTRLQRMAPPPLRPTLSFSFAHKLAAQQQSGQLQQQGGGGPGGGGEKLSSSEHINSPGAHPLSPISKRVSPMPLLSFSPLPVLSPSDNAWANFGANFESPNTAAMKHLAQSIIDGKGGGHVGAGRFPWSPLGLASPGLPGPELFPDVKMIDSPEPGYTNAKTTNNDSSNKSSNEFSFPEL